MLVLWSSSDLKIIYVYSLIFQNIYLILNFITYSDSESDSLSCSGNSGNLNISLFSTCLFFFGDICLPSKVLIAVFLPKSRAISRFSLSD